MGQNRHGAPPVAVHVYNTMTRSKEPLHLVEPQRVHMYVCGPTVYDRIHIGNARPLIFFDTVRRYLSQFYHVRYVVNITDVDDKIIHRAQQHGETMHDVAQRNIAFFMEDMDALRVRRADHHPRVTEHIDDIVAFIAALLERGCAYVVDGDVYFRTASFPTYGRLTHVRMDALQHGIRVAIDERKESPHDFALWKSSKAREPSWPAPWGTGRPGWHIECSAMARAYLGDTIDIHGGGADLQFPHHECEIAQSESRTGQTYVRHWMHNAFIQRGTEKMSKSIGNVLSVSELLSRHRAEALRYVVLATHYRNPLQLTEEALTHAANAIERLAHAHALVEEALCGEDERSEPSTRIAQIVHTFHTHMSDDFQTPDALTAWFSLVTEAHAVLQGDRVQGVLHDIHRAFLLFDDVLGLLPVRAKVDDADIASRIAARQEARAAKDFAKADHIRDALAREGIILEDTPQGVRWRRRSGAHMGHTGADSDG
ncbi:MAG: cysteine--tRNA ligase [Paenibacillaceae bacterium]|nr:cysteine--tRNA ligase [Paenibacillaceae bacterium]